MTFNATWVMLWSITMIALVMLNRLYRAANTRDLQINQGYKLTLELAREETMRLQLLVKAADQDAQGCEIKRRKWWPGPPEPPPIEST